MTWMYQDKPFTEEQVGQNVGFVYLIENLHSGRKYIGKKLFTFAKTRGPLKGRINRRRSRVTSDWQTYFGSNKELITEVAILGAEKFQRTILHLCESKAKCNYWEAKLIFQNDALLTDDWYNGWISTRINSSQLVKK